MPILQDRFFASVLLLGGTFRVERKTMNRPSFMFVYAGFD